MARIIFDLDGTLIDSAPDIQTGGNEILIADGLAPLTAAETRSFIGNGAGVFIAKMRAARDVPDSEQDRMLATFLARYETLHDNTTVYPHVPQTLAALAAQGHRLGLCTNKPIGPTRHVLTHFGLDGFFETVWGGDSLPVRKPDPAPLVAAMDALGDGPVLYVGDSEVDAETAQRAGVPFLLFTLGYRKTPAKDMPAHARFDDYATFPALVDNALSALDGSSDA